ncbi:MAG: EamA family transporter [Deltaproteobacteria bacterium]|nr:EamA family transporter [Deltaproteobacteria bacterium]MBI3390721.1 EamA family transporter [Deltaproteobacteria bacterium]
MDSGGTIRSLDPRVALAFAVVYVVWGSTYLAIRVVVASVPPAASAAVRFVSAGLLLLLIARVTGRTLTMPRCELRALALIALLLLVVGNGIVVWSEQFVPSGTAALIVATLPLWLAVLETVLPDGEHVPPMAWVGVVTGFVGLAILLWPKLAGGLSADLRGEAALLLAPLSWACGSLYSKRTTFTVSPLVATGWEMLLGGLMLAAIAAATGEFSHFAPTRAGWMALAYLVIFGSCIAFTAFVWLLQHVPAAKVATYAYVNPVIAVFLGWLLLDEPFSASMALGTPIIVAAVVLVTTAKMRREGGTATAQLNIARSGGAQCRATNTA